MSKSPRLAVVIATLWLAGCISPGGIQNDQTLREPKTLGATAKFENWPTDEWWKKLGDPELDRLIALALNDNPNIVQAAKRFDKAMAEAGAAGAALKPQVTGSADVSRQRLSENAFYPPPFGGSWQNIANATLNASWDLDFWGRNRSALNAALSQAEAAKAEQSAARLLVSTAVARAYNQLARQVAQQELAQKAVTQREQELSLISSRVEIGLDTQMELNQGKSLASAARVELEAANEAADLTRNMLAALTVQDAQNLKKLNPRINQAQLQSMPGGIPADLIGRRPDLAAARARVEAATSDIAAARAEFYPNVSLAAFIGLSSFGLSHFLDLGSTTAGIGPALHLPIFDAGRLRANLRGKNADLDLAIVSYNQTLLDAVHDVADQMTSLQSVRKQADEERHALDAAETAYSIAKQRYEAGLSNYLSVLAAADTLLRERAHMVDIEARTADLNLALVKSLGGGFETGQQHLSDNQQERNHE